MTTSRDVFSLGGARVDLGETRDLSLVVSQSYSGTDVPVPVRVVRGPAPGPVVLLTAAVHGDELNGTGIVRELILAPPFEVQAGTLILVPVVNVLGYERNSRYMPDRRDLNRNFPGSASGSLTSRVAHAVFDGLVRRCDFAIDFHTAAVRRTNFPHIRADLSDPAVRRIARAFGSALVVDNKGPKGTMRREACQAGHPMILLEAGEVWKIEPSVVEEGLRGVTNVLVELGMIEGARRRPAFQAQVERTTWLRADAGGLLRFHVAPGEPVVQGQPIATCADLLGVEQDVMCAPEDGVVMSLTTLPSVKPGDPVCHLAYPRSGIAHILKALDRLSDGSLHDRLREDLASSVSIEEIEEAEWA